MLETIVGTVKWFNRNKGFGFVAQARGLDVFLFHTTVANYGLETLEAGTPITCEAIQTPGGLQVTQILSLGGLPEKVWTTGTVKWFNNERGFGFAVPQNGEDVYIHRKVLRNYGVDVPDCTEPRGLVLDMVVAGGGRGLYATEARWAK